MPNWCSNTLTVEGPDEDRNRFYKENKTDKLELSYAISVPEPDYPGYKEDGKWYDWRLENWGCKWDFSKESYLDVRKVAEELIYNFESPWGPPDVWVSAVSTKYPTLEFTLDYEEQGNYFCGREKYSKGNLISSTEGRTYEDVQVNVFERQRKVDEDGYEYYE